MHAYKITVTGRVQGVGYRWFCVNAAKRLNIKGWVRNTREGTVEIMASGGEASIKSFLSELKIGPSHANVSDMSCHEVEIDESFSEFKVVY